MNLTGQKRTVRLRLKILLTLVALLPVIMSAALSAEQAALQQQPAPVKSPSPFSGWWQNTLDAHSGSYAFFHLGAVGATAAMVALPVDKEIHLLDKNIQDAGTEAALIGGMVWQVVPAAIVYWSSDDNSRTKYASGAVLQAIGITAGVTTVEKYLTGRRGPNEEGGFAAAPFKRTDDPADFNFLPWQNVDFTQGRFFWPSGHTASAVSVASSLYGFYPEKTWLHVITYTAAAWMGFSMVDGSHHWASDVVAGALIGHSIGYTVGKNYRQRWLSRSTENGIPTEASLRRSFNWQPLYSSGFYGLLMHWSW